MRRVRRHVLASEFDAPDTSSEFPSLFKKERYYPETEDGWTLCLTRYKPVSQPGPQPMLGEPIVLVHGFSQNRHAWTSGDFVKLLLLDGADVFVLELRGHGLSSRALQLRRRREEGRPLPADYDYAWDVDSYFLGDLPAAIAEVKRVTGRSRIFYCGHSMGGMLGYGYAASHDDLAGLVTIGAPSDIGHGSWKLRLVADLEPGLKIIDAGLSAANAVRRLQHLGDRTLSRLLGQPEGSEPRSLAFRYVPVNLLLQLAGKEVEKRHALIRRVGDLPVLGNLRRVSREDIEWLLREGGEPEPRAVVHQFARWIRNDELVCYRTSFDFKANFHRIDVPLVVLYGSRDKLASETSTKSIYFKARSTYRVWKQVRENSHIDLTMGRDVREVATEVRNLVLHASGRKAGPSTGWSVRADE